MAAETSATLRVAALGRSVQLGMLYDYRTETLVPHTSLWGSNMTPKNIEYQKLSTSKCQLLTKETFSETADLLGIDNNLKLSIAADLVELRGASTLVHDRKTTERLLRFLVRNSVITHFQSLTMAYSSQQYVQHPELIDQQTATHVVTDIAYGAQFIFVFERALSDDENGDAVRAKVTELLDKFASFRVDARGTLNWSAEQQELAASLTCRYYGDVPLRRSPTSFEEAVRAHKELPALLGNKNENVVPQQISLYPLYLLDDRRLTEKRFVQIKDETLARATGLLDQLQRLRIFCSDLEDDYSAVHLFEKAAQQFIATNGQFADFETNIKQQLRNNLPKIRAGSLEEGVLVDPGLSTDVQAKVNEWMRSKTKEVKVLADFVKKFQRQRNLRLFMGSFTDARSESRSKYLLRMIVHVTEKNDPFVNELLDYFSKRVSQLNGQVDRWFDPTNMSLMHKQIDLFVKLANDPSSERRIDFFVNEEYADDFRMRKGITTVLYRNGERASFQVPDRPGRPTAIVTAGRNIALSWSPPPLVSEDIQQYRVFIQTSSSGQWQLLLTTDNAATSARITDLPEGSYQFSIQGITVIGKTEESDHSDAVNVGEVRPPSRIRAPPPPAQSLPPTIKSPPTTPQVNVNDISNERARLDVTPAWFDEVKPIPLEKVRLPAEFNKNSSTDVRTYQCLTAFRSLTQKPDKIDFVAKPFEAAVQEQETLVVVLNELVNQLGTRLTFTKSGFDYADSAYRTACGVSNLGSIHTFLASGGQTEVAKFKLHLDLDYDDLTASPDQLKKFVIDATNDLAALAECGKEFIRILEVQRSTSVKVVIAVSRPDTVRTTATAEFMKKKLNGPNIRKGRGIFAYLFPEEVHYKSEPMLAFLQLQLGDFAPAFNREYPVAHQETRGGHTYHFPQGWYRHALNVADKYPDDKQWLGMDGSPGEWAVAYHGTTWSAVKGIFGKGLLHEFVTYDACKPEAELLNPSIPKDVKGLYVATHCDGGAAAYTESFKTTQAKDPDKSYRVVFQCRVQPGKFTEHTSPVSVGKAWRVFDQNAIRPYGLLLKGS